MRSNDLIILHEGFDLINEKTRVGRVAAFELHQALLTGRVRSYLRILYRKYLQEQWQQVSADAWNKGEIIEPTKGSSKAGYTLYDDRYNARMAYLYLDRSDIESGWSTRTGSIAQNVPSAPRRGKDGRPRLHDWDGAFIVMARMAAFGDEVPDPPALQAAVKNWFIEETGSHPSDSQIREKVKRFHEGLWPP